MTLHDLLEDLAATAPPADAARTAATSWRSAGRRRTRRRAVGLSVATGLLVVVAGAGLAALPTSHEQLPGARPLAPGEGIPSQIHDVHRWLPSLGSRPVPPVAYVYVLPYGIRPVAVSVDGSYRYLPAAPEPFHDGAMSSFAVSPDGEHIAVAWSESFSSGTAVPAVVYVYDLVSGERRGPWSGAGGGSVVSGLAWRWDDGALAWEEYRPLAPGSSAGVSSSVVLDLTTSTYRDLTGYISPLAWSPDGRSLVAQNAEVGDGFNRLEVLPMTGGRPVRLPVSLGVGPLAWSPDGRSLAVIRPCLSQSNFTADLSACSIHNEDAPDPDTDGVDVVDVASGEITSRLLAAFGPDAAVLGWRGGNPVVGGGSADPLQRAEAWRQPYVVGEVTSTAQLREITGSASPRLLQTVSAAQGLLGTAPVVDLPAPSQPRFGPTWWAYAWHQRPAAVILFWLVTAAVVLPLGRWLVRHRHGRRRTATRRSAEPPS